MARTQAERRTTTRRALIDSARALFAEQGYLGVRLEAIVAHAGVTRGALYHHFADKDALFRAVVEEIEGELDGLVIGATRGALEGGGDVLAAWLAGTDAYLDACLRLDVKQILLLDRPAVLGWESWHRLDAVHAVGEIEAGLTLLMEAGQMPPRPVRPLAHLLHGATLEAALYVAAADDPRLARAEIGAGLERLMRGLCR